MARTYRAELQASLHDAPNALDPVGATDSTETRASAFVPVTVAMTDEVITAGRDHVSAVMTMTHRDA